MKRTLAVLAGFFLLAYNGAAQSGIHIATGTKIFISANTIFSVDSLALKPSINFTITGGTALVRNATVTKDLSTAYIKRVFKLANNIPGFSGDITFYYRDTELNGIAESDLTLYLHNGSSWLPYKNGVAKDAAKNFVTVSGLSNVSLFELTLAKATASKQQAIQPIATSRLAGNAAATKSTFTFFPNPAQHQVTIKSGTGMKALSLYNSGGNLIRKQNLSGSLQYVLELQQLPKGVYILQVVLEDGTISNQNLLKL